MLLAGAKLDVAIRRHCGASLRGALLLPRDPARLNHVLHRDRPDVEPFAVLTRDMSGPSKSLATIAIPVPSDPNPPYISPARPFLTFSLAAFSFAAFSALRSAATVSPKAS